jgi:hypothetical protein
MRRPSAVLVVAATMMALSASPTAAVTGNFVRDFQHVYVGLVVFYDGQGEFAGRCSGSLLSPSVFLTAGHCVTDFGSDGSAARIYFEQDAGANFDPALGFDPFTGYPIFGGHTGTAFDFGFVDSPFLIVGDRMDIGAVVLDAPVPTSVVDRYGIMAIPGSLDALATARGHRKVTFTSSGYGISRVKPQEISFRERLMATHRLVDLRSQLAAGSHAFQLTGSPGAGGGGTCFGDSGGPILHGDTDIIVGVSHLLHNTNCVGTWLSYRVDQEAVAEWILGFVDARGETIHFGSI